MSDDSPPRPIAVRIGVPYLALPWTGITGLLAYDWNSSDLLVPVIWMVLWVTACHAMLYRVWRGGRKAIGVASLLVVGVSSLLLIKAVVPPVLGTLIYLTGLVLGYPAWGEMLGWPGPLWWAVVVANAAGAVMGIALRRRAVREWAEGIRGADGKRSPEQGTYGEDRQDGHHDG
ncbi:hypothetical protein [Actinomadura sp. 9N407]|uniref:hypothetical protein n=1 Tax=Actinomadura sp. 9N407 TaxID=3375154 RepID=UPI003795328F